MTRTFLAGSPAIVALACAALATPCADGAPREIALLAPSDVQRAAAADGRSPHAGDAVFVEGVVTASAPLGRHYYIADLEGGAWGGLKVEGPSLDVRAGDRIAVSGIVTELFGETRLLQTSASVHGTMPLPPPAAVTAHDLATNAERWEGVLVRLEETSVESFTNNFGEFRIGDATASGVLVDDEFFTSYVADPGDSFASMTGVVSYGFGSFRLEPRGDADFGAWTSGRGYEGRLEVSVTDEAGRPLPSKITLFPIAGPSLELGPEDRAEGSDDVAYLPRGKGRIALPLGTYDVVVSRGIEYGIHRARVAVATGAHAFVEARLVREVDTSGWISGDFHLHSAPSFDTMIPVPGRIVTLAGEGVEWAIATDHNEITDYAPVIRSLGLTPWITSSVGDEITTRSPNFGHFNSWPLEPGRAPLPYERVSPQQLFDAARSDPGVDIVQVNHPSFGPGGDQYFDIYRLDPHTGEPAVAGFSFDFDALEVMNGTFTKEGLENLATWMTLVNQGHRITATGNSDSHHIVFREPGYPRNFVRSSVDAPGAAQEADLVDAVRAGSVFVSFGPIVDLTVNGGGLGALVPLQAGEVHITARVQCASWIGADRAEIRANGAAIASLPLKRTPGSPLDAVIEHVDHPTMDTWYMLFVDGPGGLHPVMRAADIRPIAFTNPVYVDVDGDHEFTSPGLYAHPETIAALEAVGTNGVVLRAGEWVSLEGCTSTSGEFPVSGTGGFFLDDGTGGIRVEEPFDAITPVVRGDRVAVAGFVGQRLGETRIQSAIVASRATPCETAPIPVSTGAIAAGGPSLEPLEGRVVHLQGVDLVEGSWPEGGAEGVVTLDDGTGPVALQIPGGVAIPPEAQGLAGFSCTALIMQRDVSLPYTSGYGLLLRAAADLFEGGAASTEDGVRAAIVLETALDAPHPNPSRGALAFGVVRGTRDAGRAMALVVSDVRGRSVRRIPLPRSEPGREVLSWDGRDERGRVVGSGVYFARLEGGARTVHRRIVRLD